MFKRSSFSLLLVTAFACQSMQASFEDFGSIDMAPVAEAASEVVVVASEVAKDLADAVADVVVSADKTSYAAYAKELAQAGLANVAAVFSVANHKNTFAAVKDVARNDGFKAACNEFFSNKSTVVATGLTLAVVTAACYGAYKYFAQAKNETN